MPFDQHLRWACLECCVEGLYQYCDLTSAQRELVITGLDVVTARREIFILWYNDQTHDLVTLKSIYLLNLFGFVRIKGFSTPETMWLLIPAPAICRFLSVKHNFQIEYFLYKQWSTSKSSNCWLHTGLSLILLLLYGFLVTFYPWMHVTFG